MYVVISQDTYGAMRTHGVFATKEAAELCVVPQDFIDGEWRDRKVWELPLGPAITMEEANA